MKTAGLILEMIARLASVAAGALGGREKEPAKRVEEVWTQNRTALAKAEADDAAAKALEPN